MYNHLVVQREDEIYKYRNTARRKKVLIVVYSRCYNYRLISFFITLISNISDNESVISTVKF